MPITFYVFLPLLLSFLATLAAAVMSYGTHPALASHSHGLDVIMLSRRLQWPLISASMILCVILLALVITGKRRAWWLIALMPVLAFFVHRFLTSSVNRYAIADEPAFVSARDAKFIADDDYVVGVTFNDQAYAYPFGCISAYPIVMQSDRQQRLLLMWSPRANAAVALTVAREFKARDLDVVSDPADGLLLHSDRTGQFICSVTGLNPRGQKPAGVESRLPVMKTTWRQWKSLQPDTRVMQPFNGTYSSITRPFPPTHPNDQPIVVIGESHPLALSAENLTTNLLNTSAADLPVVVFRDATSNRVIAFDRRIESDLIPQFQRNTDRKRKALLIDTDTNTGWSLHGVAVDGKQLLGHKLARIPVQEDVYLAAARFWYPGLVLDRSAKPQSADNAPPRPSLEDREASAAQHRAANHPRPRRPARPRP